MHSFHNVLVSKFNLYNRVGFQDATSAGIVGKHLHKSRIYHRIHDCPSTTSELSIRRDINEYRLVIFPQPVDDVRAELDNLLVHVYKRKSEQENDEAIVRIHRMTIKRSPFMPPEKPLQLAKINSGSSSFPKSWIACAVLYALSGNQTCPA